MASSIHSRSNSLPSRPHPLVSEIDEHISSLNSNSSSSAALCSSGYSLQELYELLGSFLQLPHTQEALAKASGSRRVDKALNGSLMLLDACGIARDALLQVKEETQELQSILRRRRDHEVELKTEVKKYISMRKKAKQSSNKSLRDLKRNFTSNTLVHDSEATLVLLQNVQGITLKVLESFLSYVYGSNVQPQPGNWSLVSKLMPSKRVGCNVEVTNTHEFNKMDAELSDLISHKARKSNKLSIDDLQNELRHLEMSTQDLEDAIDCLQRLLIQTRVSLLNILSN